MDEVPRGKNWQYEPKWDGFRCLIFRDDRKVELQSKSGQSLTRYFPELVASVASLKAKSFVLDSEIVVPQGQRFSFDDLLQRIHPAESRVKRLAAETPAMLIVFDLLAREDGKTLTKLPLADRRKLLEAFARKYLRGHKTVRLSPVTTKIADARKWLKQVGATPRWNYRETPRHAVRIRQSPRHAENKELSIRRLRGRWLSLQRRQADVGSLLLGLYDEQGLLNHVGFTSSLKGEDKKAFTAKLEKLIAAPGFTGDKPGGPSRWSTKRSSEWKPLKPRLVVEVCYDHFSGGRFRHGTRLMRWRPDKAPQQCTMDQVRAEKSRPDEAFEVTPDWPQLYCGNVPFSRNASPAR